MRIRFTPALALVAACVLQPVRAQDPPARMRPQPRPRPDLTVAEYQFAPTNDKALRVSVANIGGAAAGASTLRLTVRKIKGAAVGRTMEIQVPAISAGQNDWVTLVADGILPKNVSLKDTTFRVNLDVGNSVSESNEKNNEKWHNLN